MDKLTSIDNKLSLGNFYFDKTGLVVTGSPTFEEWQNCGDFLKQAEKSVQFWIGDWLNYGENKYGETYSQALNDTDYELKTLQQTKWVSGKIETSRRREHLSFSHHVEVASFLSIVETDNIKTTINILIPISYCAGLFKEYDLSETWEMK